MMTESRSPAAQTEKLSLEGLGLGGWRLSYDLPRGLTVERVQAALEKARATMTPADLPDLANAIDDLITFGRAFDLLANGSPETIEAMSAIYGKGLGDLPADLLASAIDATRASWKWPRMPLPADVRVHASEEMGERRTVIRTLDHVLMRLTAKPRSRLSSVGGRDNLALPGSGSPDQ